MALVDVTGSALRWRCSDRDITECPKFYVVITAITKYLEERPQFMSSKV